MNIAAIMRSSPIFPPPKISISPRSLSLGPLPFLCRRPPCWDCTSFAAPRPAGLLLLFGSMFEASDICCRSWGKVTVLAYSLIQRCHTWNGIEPRTVLMYKRTFSENLLFSKNFVVKDGCCKLTRYFQTSFGLTRMRRLVSFPPPASCLLFR